MIDTRLLIVKRLLEQHEFEMNLFAEVLGLSGRQLSRLLKTWEDAGYIEYYPGQGRGNKCHLDFLIDIEKQLFFEIVNHDKTMTLAEINELLSLPWSITVVESLKERLMEQYFHPDDKPLEVTVMDYVPTIPVTLHPAYLKELGGIQICLQVFETLYRVDETGEIVYQLLRYDEWQDNILHLYLKKGILFSNGSLLTSEHVKYVLLILKEQSEYQYLYQSLLSIELFDDTHLALTFVEPCNNIKYMMAETFSSIYKLEEGELLGTGPYYIHKHETTEMVLKANYYYKPINPDVKTIHYFARGHRTVDQSMSLMKAKGMTTQLCYAFNELLVFNPLADRLSLRQRRFIRHIILQAVSRLELPAALYTLSSAYEETTMEAPEFCHPVKILVDDMSINDIHFIAEIFSNHHIPAEYMKLTHELYLRTNLAHIDVDLIWMYEALHQSQPLLTINLLTQSKFKEWYQLLTTSKEFLSTIKNMSAKASRGYAAQLFEQWVEQAYVIPLYIRKRVIYFPDALKNFQCYHYGTFKYDRMIVTK
ncbi:hypothetical protein ERX35_010555 [Macrococcus equipercicus]|uniref:ABC transporter substrate-binding protein n=1 Tax=Macrococcus equipercicus TaxID=69967 RepID=A0ABQ6R6D3_9STAP|nr:ABC transporter substrate-binding protein [Macrococcus equipercicus]KAA1036582.1 hypothetical protein ERX35_010555 [Macrococcus equipercicus]